MIRRDQLTNNLHKPYCQCFGNKVIQRANKREMSKYMGSKIELGDQGNKVGGENTKKRGYTNEPLKHQP